ncbi:MAG: hypothetical protein JJE05_12745 [Actinobacteria bacterium]|nr:hypothetical protein [Actinomycetota bacterium]
MAGDLSLSIDPSVVQKRLTGTCSFGDTIASIDADGVPLCSRPIYTGYDFGAATSTAATGAFTQLTGSSAALNLPPGNIEIIATFSGESICTGGAGWCSVRLMLNGTEMLPAVGNDYAFDSVAIDQYEGHSMQRVFTGILPAGNAEITVQYMVIDPATSFFLDDWVLSVQASPKVDL